MNKHELYHSEIYLGKDFSDGFIHYKYLKKVKSANGKWRYIYDESEEKNMQKDINNEYNKIADKDGKVRYVGKDYIRVSGTLKKKDRRNAITDLANFTLGGQTSKDKVKEIRYNRVLEAQKIHNKQKIKDIPKKILSKGIGVVGNALLKLDSGIAKLKKKQQPVDNGKYTRNSVVNKQQPTKPTLRNQKELQLKKKK